MKIQQTWDRIQSQFQSFYTAEEAVGGVHGNNRLGGKSLLDCVVFSRVTGVTCAWNILGDRVKVTSLAVLSNEGKAERSKSDQAIVVVIGSIRQQTTLCRKRWQRGVVGRFVVLWWQLDPGNQRNQWSEHEDTAPEVNPRLSGDLFKSATLKVGMFLNVNSDTGGRRPRKEVSAHPHIISRFQFCLLPVVIYLSQLICTCTDHPNAFTLAQDPLSAKQVIHAHIHLKHTVDFPHGSGADF